MLTLEQALAELPDTAESIAARLAELGIRGRPGSTCGCPIARYLTSRGLSDAVVSQLGISALIDGDRQQTGPPRHAVILFMRWFDEGEWPELIQEPEVADA